MNPLGPGRDPLDAVTWPVRTRRLVLRRATDDDAAPTWVFRQLQQFAQWQSRAPTSFGCYAQQFAEPESLRKTLVIEHDGAIIGDLMLHVHDAWAQAEVADRARGVQAEIGCGLNPDASGRGYATEALDEVLRLCFDQLGLRRVVGQCFADNTPSRRLMERLGMRQESHTVQDALHRSGAWLDSLSYALLADEWRARTSAT